MIDLSHVYKTYCNSIHALRNVSLKIKKGEFIFVTGASGSGKTTLFKMLSGLDRITSGSIFINNFDLNQITQSERALYRQKIGIVFQDFKLIKSKSVLENIMLPLIITGVEKQKAMGVTLKSLQDVSLSNKADSYPDFLSGGEQQRVAIARALVHKPDILIADEPTGNLDPEMAEKIMDLFEQANKSGITVIVATHDHEMIRRRTENFELMQKRILTLENGEVKEGIFRKLT